MNNNKIEFTEDDLDIMRRGVLRLIDDALKAKSLIDDELSESSIDKYICSLRRALEKNYVNIRKTINMYCNIF